MGKRFFQLVAMVIVAPFAITFVWDPPLFPWVVTCAAWGLQVGQWFALVVTEDARRRGEF